MARGVHRQPGVVAEDQRGDRHRDLRDRDGQQDPAQREVRVRFGICGGFGADGGEDAGGEVGDLGRGCEAHAPVQPLGPVGELAAVGTPGQVRVDRRLVESGVLAVEPGGDRLVDLHAGHTR